MSTSTWTQYIAMDDTTPDRRLLQSAIELIADWDDDFEVGDAQGGLSLADIDDPE